MRIRAPLTSFIVLLGTILCAAFAAPSAPAESVRGSYHVHYFFWGYEVFESVRVDARIHQGVPVGTVTIEGWSRPVGTRYRTSYEFDYVVASLEVVGNEAWLVATPLDQGRFDWVAHIVDNGPHGDTINGGAIDGNFRVRD